MKSVKNWFESGWKKNKASKGFRQLIKRTLVYSAVVFAALYMAYQFGALGTLSHRLSHPLASALEPVARVWIILAIFLFFAWKKIHKISAQKVDRSTQQGFAVIGLLFFALRFFIGTGPLSSFATIFGILAMLAAAYGFKMMKEIAVKYEREIIYTSIVFLYLLFVLGLDSAIKYVLWNFL